MSQNDFTIANQTFPNTRADINSALQALASNNSGTSAPATQFANQFWYNSSTNILYIRNEGNDADIPIMELDQTNDTVEYFKADSVRTALIEYSDGTDALTVASTGALTTAGDLSIGGSNKELRFYEGANYVGFEAPALSANKIWVLPVADGSANQALVTNGSGTLSWAATGVTRPNAKPLIINGDMQVAQRGDVTAGTTIGFFALDRWRFDLRGGFNINVTQNTDVPSGYGFANSIKLDCNVEDASPDANALLLFQQIIEGQDLQLLNYGTSSAQKLTISFWVKCTKTGTFQVNLRDEDSRHIGQLVTINSANTWEKKVIAFDGDTAGAIANSNAGSIRLQIFVDAGSDSSGGGVPSSWAAVNESKSFNGNLAFGQANANEIFFTGVQLEVGEYNATTIPPFQHESYGDSLSRCERYCQSTYSQGTAIGTATSIGVLIYNASGTGVGQAALGFPLRTVMRAVPTIVVYKASATTTGVGRNGNDASDVPLASGSPSTSAIHVENSATVPNAVQIQFQFSAIAEL